MFLQLEMGLPAARPNRYLVADGITPAAEWIASTAQSSAESVRFSACSDSILPPRSIADEEELI